MKQILIIEDEKILGNNIRRYLEMEGWQADWTPSGQEGVRNLVANLPDAVLLDLNLPDLHGLDVLREIRKHSALLPVIILTAYGSIESGVEAMKLGATHYLTKPVDLDDLKNTIQRSFQEHLKAGQLHYYRQSQSGLAPYPWVGSSQVMKRLKGQVNMIIGRIDDGDINLNIHIRGETGTGKSFLANMIHISSTLRDAPFVTLSCPPLQEEVCLPTLLGSAETTSMGFAEVAQGGALFLDHVSHLSPSVQAALLPLVKDRRFQRLGEQRERQTRCLLLTTAAVHTVEERSQWDQAFHEEISNVLLTLPPLREREGDVFELADTFSSYFSTKYRLPVKHFDSEVQHFFATYPWPGNILELRNLIERCFLLFDKKDLTMEDIRSQVVTQQVVFPQLPPGGLDLPELEKTLIEQAIERMGGDKEKSARILGMTLRDFKKRLKEINLGCIPSRGEKRE